VKLWVQQWLARKGGEPGALAVSLDADAADTPTAIAMLEMLRTAARRAGVEVFLHLGEAQAEREPTFEDIQRRAEMRVAQLDEVLRQVERQPYRHAGINE